MAFGVPRRPKKAAAELGSTRHPVPIPDRGCRCAALAAFAELCRALAHRGEHAALPGWQRCPSWTLLIPSSLLERPPQKIAGTKQADPECTAQSPNNSLSFSSVCVSHFPCRLEMKKKKQEERKGKPPGPRAREQPAPGNKSVMSPQGEAGPLCCLSLGCPAFLCSSVHGDGTKNHQEKRQRGHGDPSPATASLSQCLSELGAPSSTLGMRDAPGWGVREMLPNTSSCFPGAAHSVLAGREEASGPGVCLPMLPALAGYSIFISRAFYLLFPWAALSSSCDTRLLPYCLLNQKQKCFS